MGRSLLELGGNNAAIVTPSADIDLTVRGIVFSAVGTAGQRCTSLRRLIVHEDIKKDLVERLKAAYRTVPVGNPLEKGTLVGPLIDKRSFEGMQHALAEAKKQGGKVHGGERLLADTFPDAYYVSPAIVEMPKQTEIVKEETFAPILYVIGYREIEEAIALNNDVSQGLASSLFTQNLRAPRSAAPSAARRKPAAAANRDPIRGRPICAAPPIPSITGPHCPWLRASSSRSVE
jgi:aldehyde dehydrogenase (NAD+)